MDPQIKDTKNIKNILSISLTEPPELKPRWPNEDPFVLTPVDKSQAYVRVRVRELDELKRAIFDGKMSILIGSIGSGKTTLCEQVIADLKQLLRESAEVKHGSILPIFLPGAAFSKTEDFIRGILAELAMDVRGERAQLIHMLTNWPKQHLERLVVIIDDIGESGVNVSKLGEFLRSLADIERITIVLNGEPRKMKRFLDENPSLKDRIQTRIELKPMDAGEIEKLVRRRSELSGASWLIDDEAFKHIHKLSKGIPRRALKVASKAFRLAREKNKRVDKKTVRSAK